MKNAISIDLEDWFCAFNMSRFISRDEWGKCELRVAANTRRILRMLEAHGVHGTFFVLGWIAEQVPDLIREISSAGHEIATHGYAHLLLTGSTEAEFESDLKKGLLAVKNCGVEETVFGYRAPSFTIVDGTMWALHTLEKFGLRYDSSVFPVGFHPDYGIPGASLAPYKITENMLEFPMSCVEVWGRRLPCSGGAYFRFFPYAYTKWCLNRINAEGRPAVFYLHPWEIDPGQPRVGLPFSKRLRHYYGLAGTESKLNRLLDDFEFTTIREVLGL
jgi:polysaccharide deacetylase family protein (PEP-CTERM system associated)